MKGAKASSEGNRHDGPTADCGKSVEATGGVYEGQGRNQHEQMTKGRDVIMAMRADDVSTVLGSRGVWSEG